MLRRALLQLAAIASASSLGACASSTPPSSLRVVSLSPSTTEALFAIGAGELVVGRSRYCDFPPQALALPAVGGFADPNIEAILALRPSLVVGAHGPAGPRLAETLVARGVDTFFPETETILQIEQMLVELGKRVGRVQEGERAAHAITEERGRVTRAVQGEPRPRVAMLFDVGPIIVAGPGSYPDEIVRAAGGTNVIDAGGAYPTIDIERLLAADPDVILDGASPGTPGAIDLVRSKREAVGWSKLRALVEGRVHTLDATVLRPGPRVGIGIVRVAAMLHPTAGLAAP